MHPLEREDPVAYKLIQFVRLGYLEKEAPVPIPRHQELPKNAFGKLTGRSILVSLSHGWFFQNHPDPNGVKLDLIRNVFAPRLRARYPDTDIQVYFHYLSVPQEPRSDDEDDIFLDAMERINSVFLYADVILVLDVEIPKSVDMTVYAAKIDMSEYTFYDFIDTVQVLQTTSNTGPQKYDHIVTCGNLKLGSCQQIAQYCEMHDVTYLKRPYGRQNTLRNEYRGWVFLEQMIIVMKTAAADKYQFDDIVVSNLALITSVVLVYVVGSVYATDSDPR